MLVVAESKRNEYKHMHHDQKVIAAVNKYLIYFSKEVGVIHGAFHVALVRALSVARHRIRKGHVPHIQKVCPCIGPAQVSSKRKLMSRFSSSVTHARDFHIHITK